MSVFKPKTVFKEKLHVLSARFWFTRKSLKFCQKVETTLQDQKRWIKLSFSVLQKLQRSDSFIPTILRKSLVANRLCRSLNRNIIRFVDFVHWNYDWYAASQSIVRTLQRHNPRPIFLDYWLDTFV